MVLIGPFKEEDWLKVVEAPFLDSLNAISGSWAYIAKGTLLNLEVPKLVLDYSLLAF